MNTTSTHAASRFLSSRWLGPAVAALGAALLLGGDALRPSPPAVAPHPVPVSLSKPIAPAAPAATVAPRTKAIEEVRVGDRVVAGNPEGAADEPAVDPASWVRLELKLTSPDDVVEVVLLRPRAWADDLGARAGAVVRLDLPELGAAGRARVLSVGPCPPIEAGPGRVVTGTFRHHSAHVLDLVIEGQSEPIGVTASHPFWSEDRGRFVPASELREGERLRTLEGLTSLVALVDRSGLDSVFNIEVHSEHVYRISRSGLLVHNSCYDDLADLRITNKVGAGAARPPQHHIFPQEYRDWFAARGVPIDKLTIALDWGTHSAIHSMGWNPKIMAALFKAEAAAGRNLTAKEIFRVGYRVLRQFNIRDVTFLPF